MKRFLERHHINVSVLPPCVNYDLWKYPKWKAVYDRVSTGIGKFKTTCNFCICAIVKSLLYFASLFYIRTHYNLKVYNVCVLQQNTSTLNFIVNLRKMIFIIYKKLSLAFDVCTK